MASQILPLSNCAVARACAFALHGVTLEFPARSRSGVRDCDGMVVFAMVATAVRVDDWGVSCLLWAPARRHGALDRPAVDLPIHRETLMHCRLALRHGTAEGFLIYDGAESERSELDMLSLRVVKARREYWARWGHSQRDTLPRQRAAAGKARV